MIFLASIALACIVGLVDYWSGTELHVDALYLLPLMLAGLFCRGRGAVLLGLICAAIWGASNWAAGLRFGYVYLWPVNLLLQASAFSTVSLLALTIRRRLDREQQLARLDPLTQLANSRAFFERARVEIARARRFQRPLSVAYLDLDNFKQVNDTLGHETGDELLKTVAQTLTTTTRATDLAARLGGDEFGLLFPELSAEMCQPLVERVCQRVAEDLRAQHWPVTVSIGATTYLAVPDDAAGIMSHADELMYEAKKAGKNRVHFEVVASVQSGSLDQ